MEPWFSYSEVEVIGQSQGHSVEMSLLAKTHNKIIMYIYIYTYKVYLLREWHIIILGFARFHGSRGNEI